ncbi:xanthine dehydrogenase molybdenum binding subunit apoprotein [Brevibacterium sanguinis]|uniref:Xanthine dehydrogenase molybdenum binding subunit apoprotein n=2 Tax=Brevibacterium TaxID=1696 RepID=A0A366IK42_9MICO|nr:MULTISPECIES: xanthine dehydrogenase family protein molybdopterin-binding subunit [Brevibacterium]RBP65032.1 xanthine dehydrogenase molybdenum binding subunit apoprotein [Brevibacterium sanguinis]RBP71295.1 xanthine dehydrogenase molybdenum binding subunit apoprotein [Brevibacterium celere]
MTELLRTAAVGTGTVRLDGPDKVRGRAPYAYEHPVDDPVFLFPLQAEIARGRASTIDTSAAEAVPGVVHVLTSANAPALAHTDDGELAILRSDEIGFRGQYLGAVIATSPEQARHAAEQVSIAYAADDHDVVLREDHPEARAPESGPGDIAVGDFETAFAEADVRIDARYSTPMEHNNPMEPHTTIARFDGTTLTLWTSTQGVHPARSTLAPILGLDTDDIRIISPHVGGGFGSKGVPHADMMLTALVALALPGRAVKYATTRQQMFSITGYRAPTLQHIRLGAQADGTITALGVDAVAMSSRTKEFPELAIKPARIMYSGGHRRLIQRVVPLDVPVPSWMRAPGEAPGMVGLEIAMDELAAATGLDPIELRARNDPTTHPETGLPFNRRRLVECLRLGAERFGWDERDPQPRTRRRGEWLIGMGVASATYPANRQTGSVARIRFTGEGFRVVIGAADIGTGTWTTLTQVAADALEVPLDRVHLEIGDTDLPTATVAGGSTGLVSWSAAVLTAARRFRSRHGDDPKPGAEADGETEDNPAAQTHSLHSFGAHFAEVRIHEATGEIRLDRMLGVFSAGRIVNPSTARSQLIGGMTMGIGMALMERSELDPRFGHVVNHDLAEYHVPTNADVPDIDVTWLDEDDPLAGPLGARGIGEIGIVGSAAAIANAAHNATGVRCRDLPLLCDAFLPDR